MKKPSNNSTPSPKTSFPMDNDQMAFWSRYPELPVEQAAILYNEIYNIYVRDNNDGP